MFTFTPLLGAQAESPAVQSLLEFEGGIKILVDVGWDTAFDADSLTELERQVPTVSLILLTHPTLAHIGAYAHCCKNVPLFNRIPVYATAPVISLGRTLLQDLYASTPLASSLLSASALAESALSYSSDKDTDVSNILLPSPSNDDIAACFSAITSLKYSQPHQPQGSPFAPPVEGLTITAYASGHTLGGTIWHIQQGSESVVYAVDWNQARENMLSGAAWLGGSSTTGAEVIEQLRKPTALICSSKGSNEETMAGGWRKRDELLLQHIKSTVAAGGSVFIPSDSSARSLELVYLLERTWLTDAASYANARIYFASHFASTTIRHARSMLEWMDEGIVREFEAAAATRLPANAQREGAGTEPFNLKHVRIVEKDSRLQRALSFPGPKIFLASDTTLDWGFSRDIMRALAPGPGNLLVLTERHTARTRSKEFDESTPAAVLSKLSAGDGEPLGSVVQCSDNEVAWRTHETSVLGPNETQFYQQWLARQQQRQNAGPNDKSSTVETSADVADDASESSSDEEDESDTEHQGKVLNMSAAMTHSRNKLGLTDEELGVNVLLRRKNVHDYDVRGKRGREKIFPFVAKRKRTDEFGEVIRAEEYLRAEEKEDVVASRQNAARADSSVGEKRKWGARSAPKAESKEDEARKRQAQEAIDRITGQFSEPAPALTEDDGGDDDDSSDESEYEPAEPALGGPTKVAFGSETIRVDLKLVSIDYSSIHDKRSLQMLIPLIAPRKLILTGGRSGETASLAAECRSMLLSSRMHLDNQDAEYVFAPPNGATVDASVDTNAWTIKLTQGLYRRLQWQRIRNLGIVTVDGQVQPPVPEEAADSSEAALKKQKLNAEKSDKADKDGKPSEMGAPVLDVLPANVVTSTRSIAQSLHVGDLKLAELRRLLQSAGHLAEFRGEGTLVVDGIIAVRKTGIGQIEVESGGVGVLGTRARLGTNFLDVKRKIYDGLAVVAAR